MKNSKKGKEKGWFSCLMGYAEGRKGALVGSSVLSIISVVSGLIPYYCVYRLIDAFITDSTSNAILLKWGGVAIVA